MQASKLILFVMLFLLISRVATGSPKPVSADDILYITEDYPPYSYVSDTKLQGIAVDIMGLMLEKLRARKSTKDIQVYPWARGYKTTLQTPNTCLFAMTETKERARIFKLVGPIPKFDSAALFAKKSRKIRVQSYADLKAYKIGAVRDDIAHVNLMENGNHDNLVLVSGTDSLARMLASDRIDIWAFGELSVEHIFQQNHVKPEEYENVFRLNTGDSYYAFNRETPDALVQKFQQAFDELTKEKKLEAVIGRYVKDVALKAKR